jgi:hypothetical protein
MADKVKVSLNPSEQVIERANAEVTVTDARGRVIKLKKPGVLAQFRLIEALGDAAKNEVYTGMVLPLIFVTAIDDDPVYQPSSKREVEALIQQLDEDGIAAVLAGVQEHFGKADPEADKAALKK